MLIERGGALALVVLVVYLALAPETIVDGDNAEFAKLAATGGRAHPTGYPLYVLYLRATAWLFPGEPAHAAAMATAVLGALAVLVLHAACRAWGARPAAATLACALYAACPVVLRMHIEAEVWAGNALAVAAVLWLAPPGGPLRGTARAGLLGLVAGLGLANHVTCALLAPVGLLGVARGVGEAPRRRLAIAAALGGLVLGLAPYAYLAVADGPASYGEVDSARDVLGFMLREEYGGPTAFAAQGDPVGPFDNLVAFLATLGRSWLWLPPFGAAIALGVRARRSWDWRLLALTWLVAGPVLALRFNLMPEGLGLYVVQRFHLLPVLIFAIPVALAFDDALGWLAPRVGLPQLRKAGVALALELVLFLALVGTALPRLAAHHSPALERSLRTLLAALPPRAAVIVGGDDLCFGLDYVQLALRERPDVLVICWGSWDKPWYAARLHARGVPRLTTGSITELAVRLLGEGRAVVMNSQKKLLAGAQDLPSYPYFSLVRVLPPGTKLPAPAEVFEENKRMFARLVFDYAAPGPDDDWATIAHQRYATTWLLIAGALERVGDKERAQRALGIGAQLYPPAFEEAP